MSEQGLWGEYDKRLPEKLLIFRFMDLESGFILVAVYITCGRGNLKMGSLFFTHKITVVVIDDFRNLQNSAKSDF